MENRNYWYLFIAQTISVLGDYFGWLALQWLVYKLTGSLLAMGLIALASSIPETVFRLLCATLIDRVNKIRLMAFLDIIRFLATLLPVILYLLGVLQLWHIFVVAAITGACSAVFNPASMAVVPSLIKKDKLVRGFSLMDTSMYAASIMGPILAGVFITLVGATWGLLIDSFSFIISALFILQLAKRSKDIEVTPSEPITLKAYFKETKEGLVFFKYAPSLFVIMCFVAIKNMSSVAVSTMMVPYGINVLGLSATKIGTLSSATAIGLLVSSLIIAKMGDVKKRRIPMLGSILVQGVLYVFLGITHSYVFALIIYFFLGVSGPFFGVFSSSIYSQLVPSKLRGRVMSARLLVGGSLQPVGNFLGGFISEKFSILVLFIVAGLIPTLIATIGFNLPVLKGIDGDLEEINAMESSKIDESFNDLSLM